MLTQSTSKMVDCQIMTLYNAVVQTEGKKKHWMCLLSM